MKRLGKIKLYSVTGIMMANYIASLFQPANEPIRLYTEYTTDDIILPVSDEYNVDKNDLAYEALQQSIIDSYTKSVVFTDNQKMIQELLPYAYLSYFDIAKIERYINYKISNPSLNWIDVINYVEIGLDNAFYSDIKIISNPEALNVLVNKYNQLPSSYVPANLISVGNGELMRSDAAEAFNQMCSDAAKEGIDLFAKDGYRSHNDQYRVYWKKINSGEQTQTQRDTVSARPDHTEHQTGLAVDINSVEESDFTTNAKYYKQFKWLKENAYKYGFIERYNESKESISGYKYEPWHYRYLGTELATSVYNSGLTYDEYYVRYIANHPTKIGPAVNVDGESITYTRETYIIKGTSYLPFKETLNLLGYDVTWNASTSTISISNGHITYEHKIGTNEFVCAGKKIYTNNPTFVSNNMTYGAVRDICNLVGSEVSYEGSTNTLVIVPFEKTDKFQIAMNGGYIGTVKEEAIPIDTLAQDKITLIQDNSTYMNKDQLSSELSKYGKYTISGMPVSDYNEAMSIEWTLLDKGGEPETLNIDLGKVMNYEQITKYVLNLGKYNGVDVYSIGKSVQNRDIYMVNVAFPKEGETQAEFDKRPLILLSGSIHAQEGAGCEYLIKSLNDMFIAAQNDPYLMKLLQNIRIQVVPIINPDGREMMLNGEIDGGKCNANYVDLNRNFPSLNAGTQASGVSLVNNFSKNPDTMYYAGPYLGSEPETKAIMKWLQANASKALCHIDLHQQGNISYADKPFLAKTSDNLCISFDQLVRSTLNNQYPRTSESSTYGLNGDGGTITDYFRSLVAGMVYSQKYGRQVMIINGVETPLIIFKDVDKYLEYYKPLNNNCRIITIEIGPGKAYLGYGSNAQNLKKTLYTKHNWDEFLQNVTEIILGDKIKDIKASLTEDNLTKLSDFKNQLLTYSDRVKEMKASLISSKLKLNANIKSPILSDEVKNKKDYWAENKLPDLSDSKVTSYVLVDYAKIYNKKISKIYIN